MLKEPSYKLKKSLKKFVKEVSIGKTDLKTPLEAPGGRWGENKKFKEVIFSIAISLWRMKLPSLKIVINLPWKYKKLPYKVVPYWYND